MRWFFHMRTLTFLVFFSMYAVVSAQTSTQELVLNAHSMVYHKAESKAYILGGATEKAVSNQLLVFDGEKLGVVQIKHGPEGRTFASMAYHEKDESIILFGGSRVLFGKKTDATNLLNDTWVYKGGTWTNLKTENSPSPRAEAAIAYDATRDRILLFGGYTIVGDDYVKLADTWEFYDNDWHKTEEAGPSARNGAALSYYPILGQLVLFGGSTIDKQYGSGTGDTWTWNGEQWDKLQLNQPANIFNTAMAYDETKRQLIRFGGWNGRERTNETWAFNGDQWSQLRLTRLPEARNHSQLIYDKTNQQLILFGGHNGDFVFGDLWVFHENQWEQIIHTAPKKRMRNGH